MDLLLVGGSHTLEPMKKVESQVLPQHVFGLESPVGYWSVTTTENQVLALEYLDHGLETVAARHLRMTPETKLEMRLECMLSRYFKGEAIDFSKLPLAFPSDSNFLSAVMKGLQAIPFGECRDYQWMANHIGNPKATRAVGGALGRNPLPILIPCHRIISRNGLLGGFMRAHPDGSRIKSFLLGLEGVHFSEDRLPGFAEAKPAEPKFKES